MIEKMHAHNHYVVFFDVVCRIGTASLASGLNDRGFNGNPSTGMTPTTPIPIGSTTKTWTAVAIMQATESGQIKLDDLASTWVDPVLQILNKTTFNAMFPGTETVTIGDLMRMQAGLGDYDDRYGTC
jgi:CubicO group peptidase (beta-lactamase class C family)